MHKLTFPAPRRYWPQDEPSRPWQEWDVRRAIEAGCWFQAGRHDFATNAARMAAFGKENAE